MEKKLLKLSHTERSDINPHVSGLYSCLLSYFFNIYPQGFCVRFAQLYYLHCVCLCCTLRSWFHACLGPSPRNFGRWNIKISFLQFCIIPEMLDNYGKLSELYLNVPLSSNGGKKLLNSIKSFSHTGHNFIAINDLLPATVLNKASTLDFPSTILTTTPLDTWWQPGQPRTKGP